MSDSEARQAASNARQEVAQATGDETPSGWTPAPPSEPTTAEGSVSAPDDPTDDEDEK